MVFGVPRIWEKFHAGVTAKLAEATGLKTSLVEPGRAGSAARDQRREHAGASREALLALQYALANRLIYSQGEAGARPRPGAVLRERGRADRQGGARVLLGPRRR